jgi:beta-xylosidase
VQLAAHVAQAVDERLPILAIAVSGCGTAKQAASTPAGADFAPASTAVYVTGVTDLWAPDISLFNGAYHLYYAASTFNSKRSCIGHATRAAMNSGSWLEDGGPVICSNVDSTVNWNAIDPNVILDETNSPWLVFGSGWDGIEIVRLTSAGALDTTSPMSRIATPERIG